MSTARHRLAHGFTLLELLIALAIFGLLSVMSYSGLTSVLDQHARTDAAADRLGELQKIYLLMQRDFEQIVARPVRSEYGDQLAAVEGGEVLQFTRGGWRQGPRVRCNTAVRVCLAPPNPPLLMKTIWSPESTRPDMSVTSAS